MTRPRGTERDPRGTAGCLAGPARRRGLAGARWPRGTAAERRVARRPPRRRVRRDGPLAPTYAVVVVHHGLGGGRALPGAGSSTSTAPPSRSAQAPRCSAGPWPSRCCTRWWGCWSTTAGWLLDGAAPASPSGAPRRPAAGHHPRPAADHARRTGVRRGLRRRRGVRRHRDALRRRRTPTWRPSPPTVRWRRRPGSASTTRAGPPTSCRGCWPGLLGRGSRRRFLSERLFGPLSHVLGRPRASTTPAPGWPRATSTPPPGTSPASGSSICATGVGRAAGARPETGWTTPGAPVRSTRATEPSTAPTGGWWATGTARSAAPGYEGQSIDVCPALDLVVVRLGKTPAEQAPELVALAGGDGRGLRRDAVRPPQAPS